MFSVFLHGPSKQPTHPRASLLLLSKETNFPVRLSQLSRSFSFGTDFLVVLYDRESLPKRIAHITMSPDDHQVYSSTQLARIMYVRVCPGVDYTEAKKQAIDRLDAQMGWAESRPECFKPFENARAVFSFPSEIALEKIMHYEAHLGREFDRTL